VDNEPKHYCSNPENFPPDKFLQIGQGKGEKVLIVGESPASCGWRKSGKAFYTVGGKIIPSGRNLNKLLQDFDLGVETCGFTEIVKCYVAGNRNLLTECGKKCWPIFEKQISRYKFKLLIVLGLKTLEIINQQLSADLKVGTLTTILIGGKKYFILPIYHPSPINPFNFSKNKKIFLLNKSGLKKII